ncbi:MAG TPA: hypothetical protein VM370_05480 [Candidatus Thermoplasmatota archaeon]|nr:hypothetical protein [Candidatus Thermoplasmatota archaeon]
MFDGTLEEESGRRSRTREEILLAVDTADAVSLARIAELSGISERLIRLAIDGKRPYFRPELSPVALGLIAEVPRIRGRAFTITPRGSWRARGIREARLSAARRLLAQQPSAREDRPGGRKRG